jgi:hypothetical protein
VSYSVHPSPILGDGRMDALKDGRGMDARWTGDGHSEAQTPSRNWQKNYAQFSSQPAKSGGWEWSSSAPGHGGIRADREAGSDDQRGTIVHSCPF